MVGYIKHDIASEIHRLVASLAHGDILLLLSVHTIITPLVGSLLRRRQCSKLVLVKRHSPSER